MLKEIGRVVSLPCDTFDAFEERQTAGVQLAYLMPIRLAELALHLEP
jgi:hypothetical protein